MKRYNTTYSVWHVLSAYVLNGVDCNDLSKTPKVGSASSMDTKDTTIAHMPLVSLVIDFKHLKINLLMYCYLEGNTTTYRKAVYSKLHL